MVIQLANPLQDEKIKMQQAQYMPRPTSVAAPQKGPLQAAGESIGGNVAGKVVDGALFGGETGASLGMGNTGLISKGMSGLTGMLGGGAGAGSAAGGGMLGGALPAASGLGGATAGTLGAGAAGAGLTAGLAAAAPIALPALIGAKMFGLFNSGGPVHASMGGLMGLLDSDKFKGPLASMLMPQYKEHGGMTAASGPLSNNKSVKMERKETIEYKN